jgi:PHD/YefM family antitoxin component YafN of YafNO toxin-antitoxin module
MTSWNRRNGRKFCKMLFYLWGKLVQPVAVTRNGRERTVTISVEEYHRLKRRDRQVLELEDFTDEDVAALEKTRAPDSSKAFDHELKL